MNDHDRDNLKFLLNIDDDGFEQFLADSDDDDIEYALELIQQHRAELIAQEIELEEAVDEEYGLDLSDAQAVLSKFRL